MRVVFTWVLPFIRLALVAVVAIALAKVAFFSPDPASQHESAVPTGHLVEPTVAVAKATVTNEVKIDATVEADAAASVKVPLAGLLSKVLVGEGQAVAAGETIATVRSETPREPLTGPDGQMVEQTPLVKAAPVITPVAGRITGLEAIVDQDVAVGDTVARVSPPTFHLTAPLTAAQQYRLVSRPTEGTVSITGGPAPFTCTSLSIGTVASSEPAGAPGADAETSVGQSASCAVPSDVTVFAGLAAKLTIPAGIAKDVLTVPLTAVEGAAGKGIVYLAGSKSTHEKHDVALGINDGELVEITSGLTEGQDILEFVPGAAASDGVPDGCSLDESTGELICG